MYGDSKTYKKSYKKAKGKGKAKPKRKVYAKMQNKTVRSIVKKEIAKNIENKMTASVISSSSLMTVDSDASGNGTVQFYVYNPYQNNLFYMDQGTNVQERIGNRIKLKRWVIKGSVYFDPEAPFSSNNNPFIQGQGYVDIYIGRPVNMANQISNTLPLLYQNGASSITPIGELIERTYSINKDTYKVYWRRRYKIGLSGNSITNNDYSLNREFGLDLCKLVCKNHVTKYDDETTQLPNDALLSSITIWATFTQPNADVLLTGITESTTFYSPVRIKLSTYVTYEDA